MEAPDSNNHFRKRARRDIDMDVLPRNPIPGLLQLFPCPPTVGGDNLPTLFQSQNCESDVDDRSECSVPHFHLPNWLHQGNNCSMDLVDNTRTTVLPLVKCTDDGEMNQHTTMGSDISPPHLLHLSLHPTKKLPYRVFMGWYQVPYFSYSVAEYISRADGTQNSLEFTLDVSQRLHRCRISVWDFVRFLTEFSTIKWGSIKFDLNNEDVVHSERSLKFKGTKNLAAAVVSNFREIPGIQAWCLCRVCIIFAFPHEFHQVSPVPLHFKCHIPSRLAYVELYSNVEPSDGVFYKISPMMDDDKNPIGGIIPVTDIRGSVPLSRANDGLGECNIFLASLASINAVVRRKCNYDPFGKKHQSFTSTDNTSGS